MTKPTLADGNWDYVLTLLPAGWEELARTSGGVRRLRGAESLGSLLRTLLLPTDLCLRLTRPVGLAHLWTAVSSLRPLVAQFG